MQRSGSWNVHAEHIIIFPVCVTYVHVEMNEKNFSYVVGMKGRQYWNKHFCSQVFFIHLLSSHWVFQPLTTWWVDAPEVFEWVIHLTTRSSGSLWWMREKSIIYWESSLKCSLKMSESAPVIMSMMWGMAHYFKLISICAAVWEWQICVVTERG